jgi:hypothetical protein
MLEVRNRTPYSIAIVPGLDRHGRDFAIVAIKGTFDLPALGASDRLLPLAEEQTPLVWADEFYDEPDSSSMKYESEVGPAKSGTDVALVGHAYAPDGRATEEVDVTLQAGPLAKTVRVFGDRRWRRALGVSTKSSPEPFERMPLTYERAFGGADVSHRKEAKHRYEERNPVGTGFTTAGRSDHFDDLPLPNLEDPDHLIGRPKHKPPPAGFGFIGRHWEPRKSLVGTYDDSWLANRCPLLPPDFDERYFRSAHPGLCAPDHFRGGEPVSITNASPEAELRFAVPCIDFEVKSNIKGEDLYAAATIDTLLVEPDLGRVSVLWKATLQCPRRFLLIHYVRIRELGRTA